uniref:alanine transaminase n=1 Tax=Spodoptera frugiperda TaxID=7108 RepID=A0A2H1W0H2_SPOFR
MSQIKLISRASRVLSVSGAAVRTELSGTVLQSQGIHTTMASDQKKALTLETMNPHVKKLQYAVRGPLVIRAAELEKEIAKHDCFAEGGDGIPVPLAPYHDLNQCRTREVAIADHILEGTSVLSPCRAHRHCVPRAFLTGAQKPFKRVIKANIGDAHAMGQKPITFIRQVVACVSDPSLLECDLYPSDVKERAKGILAACAGQSVGAYTMSYGIELIRRHVAEYIEQRDGHKANWQDICLSGGASGGIKNCLQLLCNHKLDGKDTGQLPSHSYCLYSRASIE